VPPRIEFRRHSQSTDHHWPSQTSHAHLVYADDWVMTLAHQLSLEGFNRYFDHFVSDYSRNAIYR
jgi:hypothetical protein